MKRRSYPLALLGLSAVLLAIGGFSLWAADRTNHMAARSARATRLAVSYEQARYAVALEESLERKYRLEPGPAVRRRYEDAAASFDAALEQIRARGSRADLALVEQARSRQRGYLRAIGEMFAALDAHETARVLTIDATRVDPVFAAIDAQVEQAARAHSLAADRELSSLQAIERAVLVGRTIGIASVLLLFSLFTVVLVRANRQLRRHALDSEHAALHDALTGLPNRSLLIRRLKELIASSADDSEPLSLLMIDLDRFKEINDTLGHHTGDLLLQAIGPRIRHVLRPTDTLARLGGDEFAVLMPTADADSAGLVALRVLAELRKPVQLPSFVATIDASIGFVTYPTHGQEADTLLQRADIAMYLAKTQRSGAAVYDPAHDPYHPERLALISELHEAIATGALEIHYQPTFSVRTLRPIGVEALARWRHPEHGLIGPDEFIPLAEHTGLIKPLTDLVLRCAVRQCRTWREAGHDLTVSVNLSVANLLDPELVANVRRILEEEGLAPAHLQLEITESMIMSDPDRARDVLLELAAMGIALSVDDFGTGYSSLAYLRRLPVQQLKIDRSFVQSLAVSDEDAAVVRATIELGHSLGLTIVAEGVEDAGSLQRLRDLHCDSLQGFHLCRPQPPEALLGALDAIARSQLELRLAS